MPKRISARRYVQAVFEIALEKQELDRWLADLRKIASLGEDTAVAALFENPKLRFEEKAKLVASVLGDVNPLALNLAYLLVAKGKWDITAGLADGYERLLDSYRGIERADVTTAIPLDNEDRQKLETRLGTISGKKVVVTSEVDTGLLGGVVARMGGKLIDGSVRSKLEALKKEIITTPR